MLSAELTLLDGLLDGLLRRLGVLKVRQLVMDGCIGNYPTTWLAAQQGVHLINKLRHNAVLFFPYAGPTPRYGDRLDYSVLPLDARLTVVSEGRWVTDSGYAPSWGIGGFYPAASGE